MPTFNATVETEVEVEFEVFCAGCGTGLCGVSRTGNTSHRGMPYVEVEPCSNCLERAIEKSYEDGYNSGYDEGIKKG